ncbi:MAG: hypothetical protein ABIG64_06425 [Candidatus Omnitrophota bacterium]
MVVKLGQMSSESKISAFDSSNKLLTNIERINQLYDKGMEFEAAICQMAIIEALTLFYLKARIQADKKKVKEDIKKIRKNNKLTFGTVKKIIINNNVLEDNSIGQDLINYVDYRNDLAHNLIETFNSIDLKNFYKIGQKLINFYYNYLLKII